MLLLIDTRGEIMHYNKDEIKNSLTVEQVSEVFMELGGAPPVMRNGMFMGETICHNPPGVAMGHKLLYYDNTKLFRCYTECREAFDIYQLVQKTKKIQHNEEWSLPRAVTWVARYFGFQGEYEGFEGDKIEDWKIMSHYKNLEKKEQEKREIELKFYDRSILDRLPFVVVDSWQKEGIKPEVMKKYGIKFYPTEEKIVMPHEDENNNLIGIRGRTLVRKEAEMYGKYMPIKINGLMYNHPLSFALYGLNHNKENIKRAKKAIIFEGEKSVMLYESYFGVENNISVASCGSSISSYQFELLRKCDINELVIAYDRQFKEIGDSEFQLHVKSLRQLADKFKNYVTVSIIFDKFEKLNYKDSPIDQGKETFEFLFKNRIFM